MARTTLPLLRLHLFGGVAWNIPRLLNDVEAVDELSLFQATSDRHLDICTSQILYVEVGPKVADPALAPIERQRATASQARSA